MPLPKVKTTTISDFNRNSTKSVITSDIDAKHKHKKFQESIEELKISHKIMRCSLKQNTVESKQQTYLYKQSHQPTSAHSTVGPEPVPVIDFTLYGSAAPICLQRPVQVKPKIRPSQPPNSPDDMYLKKLSLPVDQIVLLSQKLSTHTERINVPLTNRQIKVNDGDNLTFRSTTSDEYPITNNDKIRVMNIRNRYYEGPDLTQSPKLMTPLSSAREFPIDLSSVTNSDNESDSSSEVTRDVDEYFGYLPKKRETPCESSTSSTWSRSPSRCIWIDNRSNKSNPTDNDEVSNWGGSSGATKSNSGSTNNPWSLSTKRSSEHSAKSLVYSDLTNTGNEDHLLFKGESEAFTDRSQFDYLVRDHDIIGIRPHTALPDLEGCLTESSLFRQPRAHSADLICMYVNTVNSSSELAKYFITCTECREPSCICEEPRNTSPCEPPNDTFHKENIAISAERGELKGTNDSRIKMTNCDVSFNHKASDRISSLLEHREKNSNIGETPKQEMCEEYQGKDRSYSSNSKFSEYSHDRLPCDSNESFDRARSTERYPINLLATTIQDIDRLVLGNNKTGDTPQQSSEFSMSLIQLATAAQCARLLADSLEGLLEINKKFLRKESNRDTTPSVESNSDRLQVLETYFKVTKESEIGELVTKIKLPKNSAVSSTSCNTPDVVNVTMKPKTKTKRNISTPLSNAEYFTRDAMSSSKNECYDQNTLGYGNECYLQDTCSSRTGSSWNIPSYDEFCANFEDNYSVDRIKYFTDGERPNESDAQSSQRAQSKSYWTS